MPTDDILILVDLSASPNAEISEMFRPNQVNKLSIANQRKISPCQKASISLSGWIVAEKSLNMEPTLVKGKLLPGFWVINAG